MLKEKTKAKAATPMPEFRTIEKPQKLDLAAIKKLARGRHIMCGCGDKTCELMCFPKQGECRRVRSS